MIVMDASETSLVCQPGRIKLQFVQLCCIFNCFFPQTKCEHFLPEAFYFIVFTFFVFCIPVFLYCLQPSIKIISQHHCVVSVSGEGGVCVCVTLWNFFGTSEQSTTKQFDVRLHSFRKHLIITLRFKGIKRFNSQRLQWRRLAWIG